MEEELKELMIDLLNELKAGINENPIYVVMYLELFNLLEEYYNSALIENKCTNLRMKHLIAEINDKSSKLSSKSKLNLKLKSLSAKLIKFNNIIFDFNNSLRLEINHYKSDVWTYLKSNYKIKKHLINSLYQARHCTTLTMTLADKVDSDWKELWDQLTEKVNLVNRVLDIFKRGKYIDPVTAFKPTEDSFIVIQITASALINRIDSLLQVKNLTKLDKYELKLAQTELRKFKAIIPKVIDYHHKRLAIMEDYKRIHSKYNS